MVSFGGYDGLYKEYKDSIYINKVDFIYVKSLNKSPFDCYVYISASSLDVEYREYIDSIYVSGTQKIVQHDSGFVLRGDGVTSDFFSLDVYGYTFVSSLDKYYPKIEQTVNISVHDVFYGYYNQVVDDYTLSVTNPTFDDDFILNENPAEICIGDLDPPFLLELVPVSGTHLIDYNSTIAFSVSDTVGGVDISSLCVTISGNNTYQTGGYNVVVNGVEQVPYVTIVGDKYKYSILYTPPLLWSANEKVTVNVFGQDLVPEIEGVPFSCTGGSPNTFNETYYLFILNYSDVGASITAVADTDSPYLDSVIPIPYTFYADSASNISFDIKDDTTGVNIDTVNVYINNIPVVIDGVSQSSEVVITDYTNYCSFVYSNLAGFEYGSVVTVRVVAEDNYSPAPNLLDYSYFFYAVSSSTLEIEDFTPAVGVTRDLENVDISAYIHDDIYDIDQTNLYLSINGETCSATIIPVYGNRYLTSTVSGITSLNDLDFYDTLVSNTHLQGITLSYPYFAGGVIISGSCSGGYVGSFDDPFYNTPTSFLVGATLEEGTVVSGTISTVLVSGINWDGKTVDSTISNVNLLSLYSIDTVAEDVVISGTIGATINYHPINDYNYGEPINVLIHAENNSSSSRVIKEELHQLLYGYDIKVFNKRFNPKTKVDVSVVSYNTSDFKNYLYNGFYFTTLDTSTKDLGASITGITPWEDITASIQPQAPVHRYGETVSVTVYVKDLVGNELGPYIFRYTIEDEP